MNRIGIALRAGICQVCALATILVGARLQLLPAWPIPALALLEGLLAAACAVALRLPRWWWLLQLLFVPAVVMAERLQAPAWLYALALALLVLVYGAVFRTGVPLFLSSRAAARTLASWLPAERPLRIVDLGSGSGSLVRMLATAHPRWRLTGLELAWLPWWWSRLRARGLVNERMLRGDLWKHPLHEYDVVYAFLSPQPMAALWAHVQRQLPAGGWLVSNNFEVPGRRPDRVLKVRDRRRTRLLLYRVEAAERPSAPPSPARSAATSPPAGHAAPPA